jgi:hypothetical protein
VPEGRAYSIRLSKRFEALVKDSFGSFERWDEISESLTNDIPLNPTQFPEVPGTRYRAATLETSPRITVFFTIEEEDGCVEYDALG